MDPNHTVLQEACGKGHWMGVDRENKSRLRCKKYSSFEILLGSSVKNSVLRKLINNQSILRHVLSVNLPVE